MALHKLSFLLLLLTIINAGVANETEEYSFLQSQTPVPRPPTLKLSHFRFYFHDIVTGQNPPSITIAKAMVNTSATTTYSFGDVSMVDDPLTVGPEITSKLVGRAQGIYAQASTTNFALLMAMNFFFTEGKYNGSTLALFGRNSGLNGVKEMPIVGGSGLFRMARGYVQAKTYSFNATTGDAVVQYNVFVEHY